MSTVIPVDQRIRFRPYLGMGGSVYDAVAHQVIVRGVAGLAQHLREQLSDPRGVDDLIIEPYSGPDDRIGWRETRLVKVPGHDIPVGFCEFLQDDQETVNGDE